VLSRLAYFILGSNLWGWCYLFAVAFFAAALVMPLGLGWAPLAYGMLWSALLVGTGLYLRRLGGQEAREADLVRSLLPGGASKA
jgi:hypothetical protein